MTTDGPVPRPDGGGPPPGLSSIEQRIIAAEDALADGLGIAITASWVEVPVIGGRVRVLTHSRDATAMSDSSATVLLHGATLPAAWYLPLMAHLRGTVVAVDLPGHGCSDGMDPRHTDLRRALVAVVTAVIARCGGRPATIVGNSLGGIAALWTALDAPHLVDRCVLLGAPGVAFGGRADLALGMLAVPPIARAILAGRSSPPLYARVLAGSLDEPALRQVPDLGRGAYWSSRRPVFRRTIPRVLADLLSFRTPRPRRVLSADELGAITVPTRVAWGRRERFTTVEDARATRMPDATLHIVYGGHVPWLTDPSGIARLVTDATNSARTADAQPMAHGTRGEPST